MVVLVVAAGTARGWGCTGQGLSVLHETPTFVECPHLSASSTPPSCSTRPAPPARLCTPLRQRDQAHPIGQDDRRLPPPGGPPRPCPRCHEALRGSGSRAVGTRMQDRQSPTTGRRACDAVDHHLREPTRAAPLPADPGHSLLPPAEPGRSRRRCRAIGRTHRGLRFPSRTYFSRKRRRSGPSRLRENAVPDQKVRPRTGPARPRSHPSSQAPPRTCLRISPSSMRPVI